ncbi:MAG: [Fe-Fe] hydrogenase large subunit C-terminal domain-containing protein [Bacteroidota bacterium]|nr:[Fe-Fe] hydrogenase large subunit C-terminal domain-containing protein [Bacteroidota bacterium]
MFFTVEINNQKVTAKKGETILSLLNRNGIFVPTLCHMPGFSPTGSCRMCVVEVEGRSSLVPSCSQLVEEWMSIKTHSPRVIKARKTLVELLLANHPDDCLYCDRTGNCELQKLAIELNVTERRYRSRRPSVMIDRNCSSLERDSAKCISCGRCIRICDEIIGVKSIEFIGRGHTSSIGTAQNKGLNLKSCIKCGQCISVCPTGAIREKPALQTVIDALGNDKVIPVIQLSSLIPFSIGEELGIKSGKDILNLLRTALRKIGFRNVFDSSFGADLVVMEEAAELMRRIQNNEKLPVFSSYCPSWNLQVEQNIPRLSGHLSDVLSPQQIIGNLIKFHYASRAGVPAGQIFSVSVMPCTSRKTEADRNLSDDPAIKPVDAVLTTRELAKLLCIFGIDFSKLEPEVTEGAFGTYGSSGKLFGVAGGVAESVTRTLHYMMTGQELKNYRISELRGNKGRKEGKIKIGKMTFGVAVVNGMSNLRELLAELDAGKNDIHFVEVMACPMGCVNGGGQSIGTDEKSLRARIKSVYDADEEEMIRAAHKNPIVNQIYDELLKAPLSPAAMNFLHKKPLKD